MMITASAAPTPVTFLNIVSAPERLRAGRGKRELIHRVDRVHRHAQVIEQCREVVALVGQDGLEVQADAVDASRADLGDDVRDQ